MRMGIKCLRRIGRRGAEAATPVHARRRTRSGRPARPRARRYIDYFAAASHREDFLLLRAEEIKFYSDAPGMLPRRLTLSPPAPRPRVSPVVEDRAEGAGRSVFVRRPICNCFDRRQRYAASRAIPANPNELAGSRGARLADGFSVERA